MKTLWRFRALCLWSGRGARIAAYGFALLIGLALALHLIPLDDILGRAQLDRNFAEGDRIQHIIGQRYFIADAWRWPLLLARPLAWPGGTNISLTDSIPLLAIPAKLLRPWLPPGFHAIFTWLAIAYIGQPVAAVFALRGAGERRLLPAVAASVMSVSMPTFLYRYIHAALSGHFLILLALGGYLRGCAGSVRARWLGPLALLPVSLLVHPYLMVMVAAVLLAAPVSLLLARDPAWRQAAAGFAAGVAALAVTAVVCGYGGAAPALGYGLYAMDLLAPFRPEGSTLWPVRGPAGEGYQYLGAGLLLLAASAVAGGVRTRPSLRRHRGLVLAACGLAMLAISTRVQIGHHVIFSIKPVPGFLNQLRSSGRLFWPVAYFLLIGGIATVMRSLPGPVALGVVGMAALLQFADAAGLRHRVYEALNADVLWPPEASPLRVLLAGSSTLTLWPPFGCGTEVSGDPGFLETLLLASRTAIRTNTMYVARATNQVDCGAQRVAAPLAPGELRVFLTQVAAGAPGIVPDGTALCRGAGALAVCSHFPLPGLPVIAAPVVPLGPVLDIGTKAADEVLGVGWGPLERGGIFTEGTLAQMTMQRPAPGALHLTMWGRSYAPSPMRAQDVAVFAGDRRIAEWSVLPGVIQRFEAVVPAGGEARLELRIVVARAVRPIDAEGVLDTRRLGFFLAGFRVTKEEERQGQEALPPGPPLRAPP